VQPPVAGLQQAPGWGHGFGLQLAHSACQRLGLAQPACNVIVQVPAGAQQAPTGGQGLGEQLDAPFQVLGVVQAD
jgi:hypothetical protein